MKGSEIEEEFGQERANDWTLVIIGRNHHVTTKLLISRG